MRIISIGDLVIDFYYKNGKLVGVDGGMTSHNIIVNIAKLGLETSVYGVCGNDMAGTVAIGSLKEAGTNIDNVKIIEDLNTRCFHVSQQELNGKLEFVSKKRCPICNEKRWYDESKIETNDILKQINKDDILVFDNLNKKNQIIIDNCDNRKMLDLGQYFELENYSDNDIIKKIKNKFDFINLNEKVEKYLKNRFSIKSLEDIYNILNPKMIIVTRGKKGSDFVFSNNKVNKELSSPSIEVDSTGAGDIFHGAFVYGLANNFEYEKTLRFAVLASALSVTRVGSYKSIPTLEEMNDIFPCIIVGTDSLRDYPMGKYFAHIIGYTRKMTDTNYDIYKDDVDEEGNKIYSMTDVVGQSGIESIFERELNGKDGKMVVEVDNVGRRMNTIESQNPVSGQDIFLTLDSRLQKSAYDALENVLRDVIKRKLNGGGTTLQELFSRML